MRVALVTDLPQGDRFHDTTVASVESAAHALGLAATVRRFPTDELTGSSLDDADAIVCGPGSPYRDIDAALAAITRARVEGIPFVGT